VVVVEEAGQGLPGSHHGDEVAGAGLDDLCETRHGDRRTLGEAEGSVLAEGPRQGEGQDVASFSDMREAGPKAL
jgi:hypothetical protein